MSVGAQSPTLAQTEAAKPRMITRCNLTRATNSSPVTRHCFSARATGGLRLSRAEHQPAVLGQDVDGLARLDVAPQEFLSKRILQMLFHSTPHWPSSVL